MYEKYFGWPDREDFERHLDTFQPFSTAQTHLYKFPKPEDLSELPFEVDVCTTEKDRENLYFGDVIRQDHLRMKLSSFCEGFSATERGDCHWIQSTGLNMYLSQATLFSTNSTIAPVQIRLQEEVEQPLPFARSGLSVSQINLWMNIDSSRTCLHYDQYNNILAVTRGKKVVSLISPQYTSATRAAYQISSGGANHSSASSAEELVANGHLLPHEVLVYVLEAGDTLFIPEGWWHDVASDKCSMAANYWFKSPLSPLTDGSICTSPDNSRHMLSYILRSSLQTLIDEKMKSTLSHFHQKPKIIDIDGMLFDEFEAFMLAFPVLNAACDSHIPSESTATGSTVHLFSAQLEHTKESMEDALVNCSHQSMARLWSMYAEKHPERWGKVLSELRPLSAYALTSSWNAFDNQLGGTVDADAFFSGIFNPTKDLAAVVSVLFCTVVIPCILSFTSWLYFSMLSFPHTQIRQHLVQQSDKLAEEICAKIMKDVLGLS